MATGTDHTAADPAGLPPRAALYRSRDEAEEQATVQLLDALDRGRHPVVAVLRPSVEAVVRTQLGAAADTVRFLTAEQDRSPGAVVWQHVTRSDRRLFLLVDVDPSADPYGGLCLETEVLGALNAVGVAFEHSCLYPRIDPWERIARAAHPVLRQHGVDRPSADYRAVESLLTDEPAVAHLDRRALVRDVVPHLDPAVRAWVAEQARDAGLHQHMVDQVVLATHEALRAGAESLTAEAIGPDTVPGQLGVARPSVRGIPSTRLYLHPPPDTGRLVVDIDAAWLPPLRNDELPDEEATKALWLAAVTCKDLTVSIHPVTRERSRIRVAAPAT